MFVLGNPFQSSQPFAGNTSSLPRKHLKCAPIGLALVFPQILRPDWKGSPRTNALAYWALSSAMKEKSFITFTPVVEVIILFSSLQMTRPNKLECLSLETFSSQVLEFEGKARVNPIGGPFRCFLLG